MTGERSNQRNPSAPRPAPGGQPPSPTLPHGRVSEGTANGERRMANGESKGSANSVL